MELGGLSEVIHSIEEISEIYGSIAIVLMSLFVTRAFFHVRRTGKLMLIQTRPWVGPIDGNMTSDTNESKGKEKFVLKLKNFGELQAKNIVVDFITKNHLIKEDDFNDDVRIDKSTLGTLLPDMETSYWFFIDSDIVQKARDKYEDLFIGIYISYEFEGGKSGYGIIGHFDSILNNFIKTKMWDD